MVREGEVSLTIIRNKSQQTIRVTPSESGFSGAMGRPQTGRRIVIPRIQFPDVNISVPSINIAMPRIRVSPRIRTSRSGVYGPI
jgi:hypothetical protein